MDIHNYYDHGMLKASQQVDKKVLKEMLSHPFFGVGDFAASYKGHFMSNKINNLSEEQISKLEALDNTPADEFELGMHRKGGDVFMMVWEAYQITRSDKPFVDPSIGTIQHKNIFYDEFNNWLWDRITKEFFDEFQSKSEIKLIDDYREYLLKNEYIIRSTYELDEGRGIYINSESGDEFSNHNGDFITEDEDGTVMKWTRPEGTYKVEESHNRYVFWNINQQML